MTLSELVQQAQVRDRLEGVGLVKVDRGPAGYLFLAVSHLQEAKQMQDAGRPAYIKPSVKKCRQDFIEGLDDSRAWGLQVAEAVVVLAALCRTYGIDLDQILSRKYQGDKK